MITSLWNDGISTATEADGDNERSTFATAAAMLLQTFNELDSLKNASELTWANHFYGLLALGGHSLRSIRLDGYA